MEMQHDRNQILRNLIDRNDKALMERDDFMFKLTEMLLNHVRAGGDTRQFDTLTFCERWQGTPQVWSN